MTGPDDDRVRLCALGVAKDLLIAKGYGRWVLSSENSDETNIYVAQTQGLEDANAHDITLKHLLPFDLQGRVTRWNDDMNLSLPEIADRLKRVYNEVDEHPPRSWAADLFGDNDDC